MHKYIILFFSLLVFLTACGDNAPQGTIDRQRMVSLLTDMHITDGALYNVPQVPDSLYKYGSAKYIALFKRYNVTGKQFDASFKYYSTQPVKLAEMYDQVAANIKVKVDSLVKSSPTKTKNAISQQ